MASNEIHPSTDKNNSQSIACAIVEWFADDDVHPPKGAKPTDTIYCLAWNRTGTMMDRLCIFQLDGGNAKSALDIIYSDVESCRFSLTSDNNVKEPMIIFRQRAKANKRYIGIKLSMDLSTPAEQSKYEGLVMHARKYCYGVEYEEERMKSVWTIATDPSSRNQPQPRPRPESESGTYPPLPKKRRVSGQSETDESAFIPPATGLSPLDSTRGQPMALPNPTPEVIDLTHIPDGDIKAEEGDVTIPMVLGTPETSPPLNVVARTEPHVTQATNAPEEDQTVQGWLIKVDLDKYTTSLAALGLVEWKDLCRFAKMPKATQKGFLQENIKDISALHMLFLTEALAELAAQV